MISPHGTEYEKCGGMDNHNTDDIPLHVSSYPSAVLKTISSPTVFNTCSPHGTKNPSRYTKYRPTVLNTHYAGCRYIALLVPRINNHLSSFEIGFLNIFSRQYLLRSLSLVLFFFTAQQIWREKMSRKPHSIRLLR